MNFFHRHFIVGKKTFISHLISAGNQIKAFLIFVCSAFAWMQSVLGTLIASPAFIFQNPAFWATEVITFFLRHLFKYLKDLWYPISVSQEKNTISKQYLKYLNQPISSLAKYLEQHLGNIAVSHSLVLNCLVLLDWISFVLNYLVCFSSWLFVPQSFPSSLTEQFCCLQKLASLSVSLSFSAG